jgi:hypothetical protein
MQWSFLALNNTLAALVAAADEIRGEPRSFVEEHSGALTILALCGLVLGTLLVLVPQLLRSHQQALEMQHQERMKTLEQGHTPLPVDERALAAGRVAMLVPMVVICAAATVTCFLVAYHSDSMVAVSMASWCVAGVVALAAITGGVALMGRLAQLSSGLIEDDYPEELDEKDEKG